MSSATARPATFRHGVHPEEFKHSTSHLEMQRVPFVPEYVLPLSQHTGAPSVAVVQAGQKVQRGQMIAKAGGFVSTALHAPVTGTVRCIELRPHPGGKQLPAIVIETDPYASQRSIFVAPPAPAGLPREEVFSRIQEAGLVGMGGAAFPTHVKLKVPEGKKAEFLIINGCECEPFLTCDHRLMLQRPEAVFRGTQIIMELLGATRAYMGIEINKGDAIESFRETAEKYPAIEVVPLKVKYPQGAEKMLIRAILKREIPSGKLPIDVETVVQNVATAAALADFFDHGQPLIERAVTVTGAGINRPANLIVPLGTPVRALIDYCGGLKPETRQVVLGGPLMGMAQKNLDIPVLKGTSGVLALTAPPLDPADELPCIRCGRCLEACPMFLNPSRLANMARLERVDGLEQHHLLDCFECASCSFVCPSQIPLVQWLRVGKAKLRQSKEKK